MDFFKYYKDAPSWAKGLTFVAGAAVLVGGYVAVNAIIKSIAARKAAEAANAEVVTTKQGMDSNIARGILPTYQESDYEGWGDSIVEQFSGCDPSSYQLNLDWLFGGASGGASNPANYSNSGALLLNIVKKLKNDVDFQALQIGFGKGTGTATYPGCKVLWVFGESNVGPVTLNGAVTNKLNTSEIAGLNKVLASQGITKSF